MSCTIADTLADLHPDGSIATLPRQIVRAIPSVVPLWIQMDGASLPSFLQNDSIDTEADDAGAFSFALPWPSESIPTTTTWQIAFENGITVAGIVPEGLHGPLSVRQLIQSHGWGLVSSPSSPVLAIQGPQGPQGPPAASITSLVFPGWSGTPEIVTTTFNGDGSITTVYPAEGVTVTTSFNADGSISDTFSGALSHTKLTSFTAGQVTEGIAY